MKKKITFRAIALFAMCITANLWPSKANAQIITTVAGNGTTAMTFGCCGDGGAATLAEFAQTPSVTIDGSGNLFITDFFGAQIRKVNTSGIVTTIAGLAGSGYTGDGGPASAAYLGAPDYIISDGAGNLYFSDLSNSLVRKINTSGVITTVAGVVGAGGSTGDGGPATAAAVNQPSGLALDGAGNLYICEYSLRVRKVNTSGIISTVAGSGVYGYSGDGGPATAAKFKNPTAIAIDGSGNLFIADEYNNAIRKVNTAGIITTIAGNGTQGFAGDGGPASAALFNSPIDIKFDAAGNLFIADRDNERIRKISTAGVVSTVAGDGSRGYTGDGGAATAATLWAPEGVAFDAAGNLYIGDDSNSVIRKVTPDISLGASQVSTIKNKISLSPNPNNGSFTLSGNLNSTSDVMLSVNVTDIIGNTVYTGKFLTQKGAVAVQVNPGANLPDGVYLLHINSEGENEVLRFVIEH